MRCDRFLHQDAVRTHAARPLLWLWWWLSVLPSDRSWSSAFVVPTTPPLNFRHTRTIATLSWRHAAAVTVAHASSPSVSDPRDDDESNTVQQRQAKVPAVQIVTQLPEPLPTHLQNRYYLLRHGLSTANVAQVISSDRFALAYSEQHGLTSTGYDQGKAAAAPLLEALSSWSSSSSSTANNSNKKLVFVSSPFARARQTAQACLDGLNELIDTSSSSSHQNVTIDPTIVLKDLLVERYFGRLDAEAIYTYSYVWPLDKFNVTHTAFDVESVAAVCTRLRQLIVDDLETAYTDTDLVLVSHADVLQICQLYAARADNVGEFSSFRFKNGEVRPMLTENADHLPEPSPLEKPDRSTRQG